MKNWKTQAEGALRNLEKDRQAIDGLRAQILEKQADMIHLTELGYGQPDDPEGAPSPRMRVLLDKKQALEAKEKALTAHVKQVDRVLAAMEERDRDILKECYVVGQWRSRTAIVLCLCQRWNISRSEVYRQRDEALWDFAYRMGWI